MLVVTYRTYYQFKKNERKLTGVGGGWSCENLKIIDGYVK